MKFFLTKNRPGRAVNRKRRGMMLSFELVMMLPVMLLVVLATVQFSMLLMSAQGVSGSAHLGAREAALPGKTFADLENKVDGALRGYNWRAERRIVAFVNGTLRDDGSGSNAVANAITGDEITVTVSVSADKAAPNILSFIGLSTAGSELTTTFVTRRE